MTTQPQSTVQFKKTICTSQLIEKAINRSRRFVQTPPGAQPQRVCLDRRF